MRTIIILLLLSSPVLAQATHKATISEYLEWLAGGPNQASSSFYYGGVQRPQRWLHDHCYTQVDIVTGDVLVNAAKTALFDLQNGVSTHCPPLKTK